MAHGVPRDTRATDIRQKEDAIGVRAPGYSATFDAAGVEFAPRGRTRDPQRPSLRLALDSVQRGTHLLDFDRDRPPTVSDRTIRYERGVLIEEYRVDDDLLEQLFVLRCLPEGDGDLTARVRVATGTDAPPTGARGRELVWSRGGSEAFRISDPLAFDADGRRVELELVATDDGYTMTLPGAWLATAALPITIDPNIGSPLTVDTAFAAESDRMIDVALNSTTGEWLVVWTEPFGASTFNYDVLAQRVNSTGGLTGGLISVATGTQSATCPSVAYSPTANQFYVVWSNDPSDNGSDGDTSILGRAVGASGVQSTTLTIGGLTNSDLNPDVAWANGLWIVVWQNFYGPDYDIRCRSAIPDGLGGITLGALTSWVEGGTDSGMCPSVAYSAVQNQSMCVFMLPGANYGYNTINGDVPQANGANYFLNTDADGGMNWWPDVAPFGGKFMVTWQAETGLGDHNVRARIITASGTSGLLYEVATGSADQRHPKIAFSTTSAEAMIVWSDGGSGSGDILAVRIPVTEPPTLPPSTTISSAAAAEGRPALAVLETSTNETLIAWASGTQVKAQRHQYPGNITAPDTTAPANVTNLATSAPGPTSVTLTWTVPGDDGTTGTASVYDIRYSTTGAITTQAAFDAATPVAGEPAPAAPGGSQSMTVTGLNNSTTYHFAMKTGDEVPNWSGLSNSASATTTAPDNTAPSAVTNLSVTGTGATTATLSWTAPGDDGSTGTATQYDIRYSTSPIASDAAFDAATPVSSEPAPAAAGTVQTMTVPGLSSSTTYHFAMKTADDVPQWSALSNSASGTTGPPADVTPPAAITNLAVTSTTSNSAVLSWTASGDDGTTGTASQYDVRYSTSPITTEAQFNAATQASGEPAPAVSGTTQTMTVTGLSASTTYHFAMKAADEAPNWSALSNSPNATTAPPPDITPPATVADLAVTATTETSATLQWTAPGDDGTTGTATSYDIRYSTSPIITNTDFTAATPATGEPTPAIAGSVQSMTVTGLFAGTTYHFAMRAADEVPNWSATSNNASGTTAASTDTTAPSAVMDLAVTSTTDTTAALSWTAPGDDAATGTATAYDLRYSTTPILTDADFDAATTTAGEPVPSTAGSPQSMTVTGLAPSTTYYFALKTADEVPNWSALSNSPTGTTGAATDTTPPAAVTDLAVAQVTSTTVKLQWTVPGDDDTTGTAAQYDLRYSTTGPITNDAQFAAAVQVTGEPLPSAPGGLQEMTVTGLSASTTYHFAIKAADEVPNWSSVSNPTNGTTQPPDGTPPSTIIDLAVASADVSSVTLTWTAPGDDGAAGQAFEYDVRYSTTGPILSQAEFDAATPVVGEPAPAPGGSPESFTVTGLAASTTHWFAVRTADETPSWSGVSNSPSVRTNDAPKGSSKKGGCAADSAGTGVSAWMVLTLVLLAVLVARRRSC